MQNPIIINSFIFLLIFTLGALSLSAFNVSTLKLGKYQSKKLLFQSLFFWKKFILKNGWDKFYNFFSIAKHLYTLFYAILSITFLKALFPNLSLEKSFHLILFCLLIILFFLIIDSFIKIVASIWPKVFLKVMAPIVSFFLAFAALLILPFFKLSFYIKNIFIKDKPKISAISDKKAILEIIQDSDLNMILSSSEQQMIASFIAFKEKAAREIMVPRMDIFALDAKTSIKDACFHLLTENYSRIPIFESNLDSIIGVLMYKDIFETYVKNERDPKVLDQPIKNLIKPIIYAPENKKISKLFQEFKSKKIHLAIIVDEYGGTQGIVSIEDILEEMVGEIKDEHDIGEEKLFWQLPTGGLIIDAKMSIVDLENQLKIQIPHSPEYETIGGYIFHIAGTIPSKGWKIHLDEYEIEVLLSTERCIEKIKIIPTKK